MKIFIHFCATILFISSIIGCKSLKNIKVSNKNSDTTLALDTSIIYTMDLDTPEVRELLMLKNTLSKVEPTAESPIEEIKEPYKKSTAAHKSNRVSNNVDKTGQLLYYIPDTMKVRNTYKVIVRIVNSKIDNSIKENIDKITGIVNIRTSSKMQVEMVDADKAFNIVSSNSEIQIVDSIEYTEWIFYVTPIKSGSHPLNIIASIITDDGRKDKIYNNTIFVKMSIVNQTKNFWDNEWKWIFTTLIIPIVMWLYKNRNKIKNASKESEST